MLDNCIKLKIADTVIQMQSEFAMEQLSEEEYRTQISERFNNFLYNGDDEPDIIIGVNIVDKLPEVQDTKDIFVTYYPAEDRENWLLLTKGNAYIYKSPLEERQQIMFINESFDRVTAYLLPKRKKGYVWNFVDIIYDFLQILLINYFASRKGGIFVHSIGIRDLDGRGFLFAGKSGAGKSTTAKLWYRHSGAMVLNDDRIIVRKCNGKFFIYGSPWHGTFSDYLKSHMESAPLENLFFIYHLSENNLKHLSEKEAFNELYTTLFPPFWDKQGLENIVSFCQDLIKSVPCFKLGFVDDERVIDFVRSNTGRYKNILNT